MCPPCPAFNAQLASTNKMGNEKEQLKKRQKKSKENQQRECRTKKEDGYSSKYAQMVI